LLACTRLASCTRLACMYTSCFLYTSCMHVHVLLVVHVLLACTRLASCTSCLHVHVLLLVRLACMYTSVLHVHEQVQQLARVFVSNVNIWLSSAKLQFCCVLVSKCLVFISTLQLFTRPTLFFYVALAELHLTKRTKQFAVCLVAWRSSRTSVFDQRTFPVLRSTYSWRVTTYAGKPSAVGQLTRPTQPFILSRSIWRTPSPVSGSAVWWTLTR